MDVALVGLVLPGVENHSLAVLRQAVDDTGRRADILPFLGWPDVDTVVRAVMRARPPVVGISIQSTESALPSAALAWFLRRSGYGGRIVAGGHFATLNGDALLASEAGFDGVVRFAGERALQGLATGGWREEVIANLPGLLYRDASGATRSGAAPLGIEPGASSRARRQEVLPLHLGFPAADLIDSSGCEARCAYCCVAAHSDAAARETGARYHRRDASDIAAEIAALHHEKGALVFTIMDDNLLPLAEEEALPMLRSLRAELAARRVRPIALSLQLRADVVSEEVADALADVGLVRAYVGIDGYSQPMLRTLGRKAPAAAGTAAIERLARRGIFPVCNALLLGPTIPFEAILDEIEAIAAVRGAPVHLLPIDVRAGTRYAERAERMGLVEGGFLLRHARCADERTGLMARLLTSLPTRLAERSVPIALYDLAYNLGIARRLAPEADVSAAVDRWYRIAEAWNLDQVRVLRAGAALAARGDADGIADLIEREGTVVRVHDDRLLRACDDMLVMVERTVARTRGAASPAHARGRLLSAVALSFGMAACGNGTPDDKRDASVAAMPDAATMPLDIALADVATADPGPLKLDAGVLYQGCNLDCDQVVVLVFDAQGCVSAIRTGDGGMLSAEVQQCLFDLFKGHCYPGLAGRTLDVTPHCWIA